MQERILDIAIQFARGLHYAHEARDENGKPKQIVHQDVKPGNVLLTKDGEAKVGDFGLARARAAMTQGKPDQSSNTESGDSTRSIISPSGGCTPAYCSPEQSEHRKILTPQTDIYSWAVSVLEMYKGDHPWANGVVAGMECRRYFDQVKVPVSPHRCRTCWSGASPVNRRIARRGSASSSRSFWRSTASRRVKRTRARTSCAAADTADSLNNRALSMLDLGKTEEAERLWERVLQMSQSNAEGLFNSSLHQWRTGVLTDEEAYQRIQLGSAYYTESADGKNALSALTREAGKSINVEPLFTDQPVHRLASGGFIRSIDAGYKTSLLWHGRFFIITQKGLTGPSDTKQSCVLHIYDAKTGQFLSENSFENVVTTYGAIESISLSPDAEIALLSAASQFVYYDLSLAGIRHVIPKGEPVMYMSYGPFRFLGKQHRYAYRMCSSGIGHGPPCNEYWDFFEGAKIKDIKNHLLMDADEINPARQQIELPTAETAESSQQWDTISLTDGLRLIPAVKYQGRWYRGDQDGHPLYPINFKIPETSNNGNRIVLRICGSSNIWMQNSRAIVEWDADSGKCLRSYQIDSHMNEVFIDEDGLGCVAMKTSDEANKPIEWQYRVMPKIIPEDQAQWKLSRIESLQEIDQRQRRLLALTAQFDDYASRRDGAGALQAYREAVGLSGFDGSAEQRRMSALLDNMEGVRQVLNAALVKISASISDDAPLAELETFNLTEPPIPASIAQRLKNTCWIIRSQTGYSGYHTSPDGKILLFCGQGAGPVGNRMKNYGEIRAPLGSGVYALEVASGQMYLFAHITPSHFDPHAVFSRDMRYVILRNAVFGQDNGALAVYRPNTGEAICVTRPDTSRHSLYIERRFESGQPALVWQSGIFRFHNDEELEAFTSLDGGKFQVLDADEQRGLIVYGCESERWNEATVYIWDIQEKKHVFETLRMFASSTMLARLSDDGQMLLFAPHGYEKKRPLLVYQLGYRYTEGEKTRPTQPPVRPLALRLMKCDWPVVPATPPPDAVKIVSSGSPAKPLANPQNHQAPQKGSPRRNGIWGPFSKK